MGDTMTYFEEKCLSYYSEEELKKIIVGMKKRFTTLRINPLKDNGKSLEEINNLGFKVLKSDIYDNAYVLLNGNEADLENLSCYKNGQIYLQSLSSMMPPLKMDLVPGHAILDMAAAPGGKTTQMAALSMNKTSITACELNKIRTQRLKFNVDLQGASSVLVMNIDARHLDEFFMFDEILLDAPCSGSGTREFKEDGLKGLTKELVEKSVKSQESLLKEAFKHLKKNGTMVYSTCSIFKCENEEVVLKALKGKKYEIIPISFDDKNLVLLPSDITGALTIMPNEYFEGFFMIKIKKISD